LLLKQLIIEKYKPVQTHSLHLQYTTEAKS